jgi:formate hydrogenlyase subunit 3/multisubunit Na+/H+ antiporter MnhD subunit
VVDMTAAGELALRAQMEPALFTPSGPWAIVAVLTSLTAGLLMLAQRNIKRLLVLSSIEDAGFLILGIASLGALGENGVMLAAAAHTLGKCLLFVCIALPEHDGVLDSESGLADRYPFSAFGFLIGMLALLGIPPTLGFVGRWKLYEAALHIHPALLAGFLLASILALIAYVSAFRTVWWGTHETLGPGPQGSVYPTLPRRESLILKTVIAALAASLLCAGIWPQIILQGFRGGQP